MNSSLISKYKPAIILTLALTVFLASCKGTSDDPVTTGPGPGAKSWVVSTLAGSAPAEKFNFPEGVAVDSSDNLYVADSASNRIRKITSAGVGSTLAGSGTEEEFEFNPHGIAVDSSGNVYVADTRNHRIRKITSEGVVTTGVVTSTPVGEKQFYFPEGVAVDSSDNLYVADTENNLIRKITFTTANDVVTATISTVAGDGTANFSDNDIATAAQFDSPSGVAVDSSGENLYVADRGNNRIRKIAISSTGVVGAVSTLAGSTAGYKDATGTAAQFNLPIGVTVDSSGNIYVADTVNYCIRKVVISTGEVTTFAGTADGAAATAQFNRPSGVAVDSSGILYVADNGNHNIWKIEYK